MRDVHTIRPTVSPATSVPKWTWTSADTSIAEVHSAGGGTSCNVTGMAAGTTTITGTTQNGLTASCTVTVTDAPLPESGTVNASYQVGVGGYVDIVPTLTPANATTLYEVTSDNLHVAGVGTTAGHTSIRIEGNNAGTTTITIRGANGLVMTTTVKVGRDTDRQHEKVTDPGRPAACNRPGYTDRVRCSACRYVFTESEEIPATGEHTYGEWRVVQVATATTAGLKERYCEVCRERETETIPATGSTPENPGSPGGSSSGNTGNTGSSGSSSSTGNSTSGSTSSPSANFPVRYENGVATFTTTHFSTFAVMESRAAAFQDVGISAWYMLGVEYTLQNGLMGGYSDGRFGPNDNLSRAQLAQILHNKEGKPLADGGSSFSDVAVGAWYADAISWAAANGIVGGYGDGRFGPDDNITREQLAVMLWRYSGSPAATNKELKFSDAGESGSYAVDALRWAVENGIINGKGGGILDPKGLATRAQVAQMLRNYLER